MAVLKPIRVFENGGTNRTCVYRITGTNGADQIGVGDTGAPATDSVDYMSVKVAVSVCPTGGTTPAITIHSSQIILLWSAGTVSGDAIYIMAMGSAAAAT